MARRGRGGASGSGPSRVPAEAAHATSNVATLHITAPANGVAAGNAAAGSSAARGPPAVQTALQPPQQGKLGPHATGGAPSGGANTSNSGHAHSYGHGHHAASGSMGRVTESLADDPPPPVTTFRDVSFSTLPLLGRSYSSPISSGSSRLVSDELRDDESSPLFNSHHDDNDDDAEDDEDDDDDSETLAPPGAGLVRAKNLPADISQQELVQLLQPYGAVKVRVALDKRTRLSKGQALITFASEQAAASAVQTLNGSKHVAMHTVLQLELLNRSTWTQSDSASVGGPAALASVSTTDSGGVGGGDGSTNADDHSKIAYLQDKRLALWTSDDVSKWLRYGFQFGPGGQEYQHSVQYWNVNGQALVSLDATDLKELLLTLHILPHHRLQIVQRLHSAKSKNMAALVFGLSTTTPVTDDTEAVLGNSTNLSLSRSAKKNAGRRNRRRMHSDSKAYESMERAFVPQLSFGFGRGVRGALYRDRYVPDVNGVQWRLHVHGPATERVVLATDIQDNRPVVLKFIDDEAAAQREHDVLCLVGPDYAPAVYDFFCYQRGRDPSRGGRADVSIRDHDSDGDEDCLTYDAMENSKSYVIVMEKADSRESLADYCKVKHNETEARACARRVVECIARVHEIGYVHCDLKPQHFMSFRSCWKLIDFGSAVQAGTKAQPMYTPKYCAPEVAAAVLKFKELQASGGNVPKSPTVPPPRQLLSRSRSDGPTLEPLSLGAPALPVAPGPASPVLREQVSDEEGHARTRSVYSGCVPIRINRSLDMWGLGLIMFELFSGRSYFDNNVSLRAIASPKELDLDTIGRAPGSAVSSLAPSPAPSPAPEEEWQTVDRKSKPTARRSGNNNSFAFGAGRGQANIPSRAALQRGTSMPAMNTPAAARDSHDSYEQDASVIAAQMRIVKGLVCKNPESRMTASAVLQKTYFRPPVDTVQQQEIQVLALFSNPLKLFDGSRMRPLNLMRELKALQYSIPKHLQEVLPAARFPEDIVPALRKYQPRIVQFSGHAWVSATGGATIGGLAFEDEDGAMSSPTPAAFRSLLTPRACPKLECVFLNCCDSKELAQDIVQHLPHLLVICWTTIANDEAARAFAKGFFTFLGADLRCDIRGAFIAGLAAFSAQGFQFGDPAQYLHPVGHEHWRAPDVHCDSCYPPVHGNIVLLAGASAPAPPAEPAPHK